MSTVVEVRGVEALLTTVEGVGVHYPFTRTPRVYYLRVPSGWGSKGVEQLEVRAMKFLESVYEVQRNRLDPKHDDAGYFGVLEMEARVLDTDEERARPWLLPENLPSDSLRFGTPYCLAVAGDDRHRETHPEEF